LVTAAADESGLEAQLAKVIASYGTSWEPVDGELCSLCRRRGLHDNFTDAYTKVAMIGRGLLGQCRPCLARRGRPGVCHQPGPAGERRPD
jgi:hypothetical protein